MALELTKRTKSFKFILNKYNLDGWAAMAYPPNLAAWHFLHLRQDRQGGQYS